MTPEEKKLQEVIIKRLEFGVAETIYLITINEFIEFQLN